MKQILLITGGVRSGKSEYAEQLVRQLSDHPVYLATARVLDEDFRERVRRHQARRGIEWGNIEEPKDLSKHDLNGRVVLIDCVTLWCTNYFFDEGENVNRAYEAVIREFNALVRQNATLVFVTNEIGLGGISGNVLQRHFADLLGQVNQYIAQQADKVILLVSGCPLRIK